MRSFEVREVDGGHCIVAEAYSEEYYLERIGQNHDTGNAFSSCDDALRRGIIAELKRPIELELVEPPAELPRNGFCKAVFCHAGHLPPRMKDAVRKSNYPVDTDDDSDEIVGLISVNGAFHIVGITADDDLRVVLDCCDTPLLN